MVHACVSKDTKEINVPVVKKDTTKTGQHKLRLLRFFATIASLGVPFPHDYFSPQGMGKMGNRKFSPWNSLGKDFYLVKYHFDQIYKAESRFLSIFGLYVTCIG